LCQEWESFIAKNISYGHSDDIWQGLFETLLTDLIEQYKIKRVCDIGGGANPVINIKFIESNGLDYSILDISESELLKAPVKYNKILADIATPTFSINKKFDLVFSKFLAEHITDAKQFHKNVLSCLDESGLAVHFFPTLYTIPFLVNYLVPDKLAKALLNIFHPRDMYQRNKFPAYYRWCRGPTRRQIQKFTELGYEVIEYRGFFGHGYYNKIKPLQRLHEFKTSYFLKHPNPFFTNFAYVILKKK